jgi:hypothetical protein
MHSRQTNIANSYPPSFKKITPKIMSFGLKFNGQWEHYKDIIELEQRKNLAKKKIIPTTEKPLNLPPDSILNDAIAHFRQARLSLPLKKPSDHE